MPEPVNYHERILVVGKTRSGKTTFVEHLFTQMRGCRRVAIDPKGHLSFPGVNPTRQVAHIDPAAPLIHYIPTGLDHQEYEDLYRALWQLGGPMVIWLDEAAGPTSKSRWPAHMAVTIQQGAARGIGHWACAQRPVDIAPVLRTEAEHCFMFVPRPHNLNLQALAVEVALSVDELAHRFDDLLNQEGEHSFLWYCRGTHELLDCAPIPA